MRRFLRQRHAAVLLLVGLVGLDRAAAAPLDQLDVVVIKVGGSSITDKGSKETLNEDAIDWFARTLSSELAAPFRQPSSLADEPPASKQCRSANTAFVIIHGAGSFGHHSAKEFGLKGQTQPPQSVAIRTDASEEDLLHQRHVMQGVAQTRLSVQTLNQHVVAKLIEHGVNAVSVSPFSVSIPAHGGDETAVKSLQMLVKSTLQAGLVPVLHGDACLYGESDAGILSGDTLMEMIGKADWVSRAIFLTDVDGVYTKDPRQSPDAQLLRTIAVDPDTLAIASLDMEVSGSSHAHDVTGGLKTKLASAAAIAASGKNVTIARCGSLDAEAVIKNKAELDVSGNSTVLFPKRPS